MEESTCSECYIRAMRRAQGEPLQYIEGLVEFYGCTITVTQDVLIPRPETEILVDKIYSTLKNEDLQNKELWDLCCGSGCVGIALKKALPDLRVVLSDFSEEAVAIARKNALYNEVGIELLKGDLLVPFKGRKCDFLVCNPPYLSESEYRDLDREVKDYEPRQALVAGKEGTEFYQRIAKEIHDFLNPQAKVWLEIGYLQGPIMHRLFAEGAWRAAWVEKDWAGHSRFFFLENE